MILTVAEVLCGVVVLCCAPPTPAQDAAQPPARASRSVRQTELRMARSADGRDFVDSGQRFAAGASAPDLTLLPNGELLALFDYWIDDAGRRGAVMACSRSQDEGKTWSPARLIRLRGPRGQGVAGCRGDLVAAADGQLRLFFVMNRRLMGSEGAPAAEEGGQADESSSQTQVAAILSAVPDEGLVFRIAGRISALSRPAGESVSRGEVKPEQWDPHPLGAQIGRELHLYAGELPGSGPAPDSPLRTVSHAVCRDGRRFVATSPARVPQVEFVGSLVPFGEAVRAYVGSDDGIRSLLSRNGRDWKPDAGLRLAGGWDPAVVRLADGSFLMLYCADRRAGRASSSVPVVASDGAGEDGLGTADGVYTDEHPTQPDAHTDASAGDPEAAEADLLEYADSDALVGALSDQELLLLDEPASVDWLLEAEQTAWGAGEMAGVDNSASVSPDDTWLAPEQTAFSPCPDLEYPVDYVEWFAQAFSNPASDNAFDVLADLVPLPGDDPEAKPVWPDLTNMFSDRSNTDPPGPWHPTDHPEWESSSLAAGPLLSRFRDAGLADGYSVPPLFGESSDEPLLFEMVLPHLSAHRKLAQATMADAWRIEDGAVSPDRMLDAWETTLRNANHLSTGATLIESLVGRAERLMVQDSARWALAQEVFAEEDLERALDALMEYDAGEEDLARPVRGEHAASMQIAQYLFASADADGPDPRAVRRISGLIDSSETGEDTFARLSELRIDDAPSTIQAYDAYFGELADQMRIGYPRVRAADVAETAEKYLHTNALTEITLPGLSRIQKLRARSEASRRATQLAYATHLFKARNGRWPASLDELPDHLGERLRLDPFTGGQFGYRLTQEGPTIYSASENGIDDGGVHSSRWDDEITNDSGSDDYVFWPPQH